MEKLKLFNSQSIADDMKIGKFIWELTAMFPKEKLGTIIKNRTEYSDRDGRRGYWTYVFVEKCNLREELEERKQSHILDEYKSYLFLKYIKVLKAKIGDVKNISSEFKRYFAELFLKTHDLLGDELETFLQKETRNLNTQKVSLDFQIDVLKKELEMSHSKMEELETVNKELKLELQQKNRIINSFEDIETNLKALQHKTVISAVCLLGFLTFLVIFFK